MSSDNWADTVYGFWAKLGKEIAVNGNLVGGVGSDWSIKKENSILIMSGGTVAGRYGEGSSGEGTGLYFYEASTGTNYRSKLKLSKLFVGNDNNYLRGGVRFPHPAPVTYDLVTNTGVFTGTMQGIASYPRGGKR